MKAHTKQKQRHTPRPRFVCVTLFVVCVLLLHSLDNCAAHLGALAGPTAETQTSTHCPGTSSPCELCALSDTPQQDGCEQSSETAVRTASSQYSIEHQAVTLAATVAVIPAIPQLIALSGCLHGRAVPPPAAPLSVFLRSSLPSRAPPISA